MSEPDFFLDLGRNEEAEKGPEILCEEKRLRNTYYKKAQMIRSTGDRERVDIQLEGARIGFMDEGRHDMWSA
jgi:hypothetical protein